MGSSSLVNYIRDKIYPRDLNVLQALPKFPLLLRSAHCAFPLSRHRVRSSPPHCTPAATRDGPGNLPCKPLTPAAQLHFRLPAGPSSTAPPHTVPSSPRCEAKQASPGSIELAQFTHEHIHKVFTQHPVGARNYVSAGNREENRTGNTSANVRVGSQANLAPHLLLNKQNLVSPPQNLPSSSKQSAPTAS